MTEKEKILVRAGNVGRFDVNAGGLAVVEKKKVEKRKKVDKILQSGSKKRSIPVNDESDTKQTDSRKRIRRNDSPSAPNVNALKSKRGVSGPSANFLQQIRVEQRQSENLKRSHASRNHRGFESRGGKSLTGRLGIEVPSPLPKNLDGPNHTNDVAFDGLRHSEDLTDSLGVDEHLEEVQDAQHTERIADAIYIHYGGPLPLAEELEQHRQCVDKDVGDDYDLDWLPHLETPLLNHNAVEPLFATAEQYDYVDAIEKPDFSNYFNEDIAAGSDDSFENPAINYGLVAPKTPTECKSIQEALQAKRDAYFEWTGVESPMTDQRQSHQQQWLEIYDAFSLFYESKPDELCPYLIQLDSSDWDGSVMRWKHVEDVL